MFEKRKQRQSFRNKLILSYIAIVIVPLIILGTYSQIRAYEALRLQLDKQAQETTVQLGNNLESQMQIQNEFIKFTAYNKVLKNVVYNTHMSAGELNKALNETIEPIIWYYIAMNQNYMGDVRIYTERRDEEVGAFIYPVTDDIRNTKWYEATKQSKGTYWWREGEKCYAAHSITDPKNAKSVIGVVYIETKTRDKMRDVVKKAGVEQGIYIVDEQGKIIYSSSYGLQGVGKDFNELMKSEGITKKEYIFSASKIELSDWYIVSTFDKTNLQSSPLGIVQMATLLIITCSVILIVLIMFFSKTLTKRIGNLASKMQEVEEGNLQVTVEVEGDDEISYIIYRFKMMLEKIQTLIIEVYESRLKEKEAKLKALQTQIKPHFLYNSLSMINWLAIQAEQEKISEIATELTTFYRTTLNKGKDIICVQNEIDNVKAYLAIQCINHEDELTIHYVLDQQALKEQMINFILQPIVENAIVHGIDEHIGIAGILDIEVGKVEEMIRIIITDNGVGMTKEQVESLFIKERDSYGIKNVAERIKLFYGERYGVQVESEVGRGTKVIIEIPII